MSIHGLSLIGVSIILVNYNINNSVIYFYFNVPTVKLLSIMSHYKRIVNAILT